LQDQGLDDGSLDIRQHIKRKKEEEKKRRREEGSRPGYLYPPADSSCTTVGPITSTTRST
jgi:hypothetical protein